MTTCEFCGLNYPKHYAHCPVVNEDYEKFWAGWSDYNNGRYVNEDGGNINTLISTTYGLGVWAAILNASVEDNLD